MQHDTLMRRFAVAIDMTLFGAADMRRDAGVVERGSLENYCAGNRTQGSNPCLSAIYAFWKQVALRLTRRDAFGREERIRTSGPCLPKTVLYQAELLPDALP